ncbi:Putative permease [Mariniradius saccharolyticus AK6]|uniref:Permease n=1 Tax=Mariniradius saccharolyticus AK6 TaxID=1239962 RepID=M7XBR2_9BACT|nr:DMT family transporter [Mariniradius saccharolyticus]EMS32053.1 Putative permease [Mariniradius saccharolyticus AK6]
MSQHPSSVRDYLTLHFLVLIWGFTAILGLLISIPSLEVVFFRTLIATILLVFIFGLKGYSFRVENKELAKIIGTGFIISLHWILFFWAARVSNASVCLAGMATTSLWTAFVEPIVNKKRIKSYEILLGLIVISGLYVVFSFEFDYWQGLAMAVASALLCAIFTVINGRLTKRHSPYTITLYEMMGACVFAGVFMLVYSGLFLEQSVQFPLPMDWLWLLILGGVCTVFAFTVSVELMRRLTAFAINLTYNLEPVYGIILAVIVFGGKERMTTGFYLGTLIILVSVLIYPLLALWDKRRMAKRTALES